MLKRTDGGAVPVSRGEGGHRRAQRLVAAAMLRYHREHPFNFAVTLGDNFYPSSPAAEVLFTRESTSWRMPATYYTFTAGPDFISEAQRLWLTAELDRSPGTWKVVHGHHPIYSEGQHEDNNVKIEQLLPVLKDLADVYLAGHDHDMEHVAPEGRLHFFIASNGGKLRTIERVRAPCSPGVRTASP